MAFQRLFSKRFLNSFKTNVSFERAIVSKAVRSPVVTHESFDHRGVLWRFFLLRQTAFHSGPAKLSEFPTFPEAPKDINNNNASFVHVKGPIISETSFEYMKKIMRAKLMEKVKTKLRNVAASSIQYSEFLQIYIDTCENSDKGVTS